MNLYLRSFFKKAHQSLKNVWFWLRDNAGFISQTRPGLIDFGFGIILIYVMYKIISLMHWQFPSSISLYFSNNFSHFVDFIFGLMCQYPGTVLIIMLLIILNRLSEYFDKRKKDKKLPIIGIPNIDKITILLMLFELRCYEIGRLYYEILNRQKDQKKENWITEFIWQVLDSSAKRRNHSNSDSDSYKPKNRELAKQLYLERFSFSKYQLDDLEEDKNTHDLKMALRIYCMDSNIKKMLQNTLKFGQIQPTIHSLINKYDLLKSYQKILFIYDKPFTKFWKDNAIDAEATIDEIWDSIINTLKHSLIFLKIKNDTSLNINELLQDIAALQTLQKNSSIHAFIKGRDNRDILGVFYPDKKSIDTIIEKMKSSYVVTLC